MLRHSRPVGHLARDQCGRLRSGGPGCRGGHRRPWDDAVRRLERIDTRYRSRRILTL